MLVLHPTGDQLPKLCSAVEMPGHLSGYKTMPAVKGD